MRELRQETTGLSLKGNRRPFFTERRDSWKQTTRMLMWGACVLTMISTLALPAYAKDKTGLLKATDLLKMKVQGTVRCVASEAQKGNDKH